MDCPECEVGELIDLDDCLECDNCEARFEPGADTEDDLTLLDEEEGE